jgi:23S rRNA (uracil1939-C5)-methyltransferase
VTEALEGATRIADLFAGAGTFALPLARRAAVHAVEGEAALLAALDHAARHAEGLRPVTTECRDLFRNPILPEDLRRLDGVAIDPPRAGAEAQTRALAAAQLPRIAMVSCNPVTFARDAALLIQGGYRLNWVQPVDQFRWTPHIELAASLSLPHLSGD